MDISVHFIEPYRTEDFADKIYEFKNKPAIRMYKVPPVRNFLVQNVADKWIYWGLVHILEITHDYVNKTTSGKYRIIHINTIEEMKQAYNLIDRREGFNYFK